jgi:hypothetical protein
MQTRLVGSPRDDSKVELSAVVDAEPRQEGTESASRDLQIARMPALARNAFNEGF